jgi:hypothetical protein
MHRRRRALAALRDGEAVQAGSRPFVNTSSTGLYVDAAVLTGTLGRSRVYRTWHARSVDVRAADGQPIWLSTDGEVATAESGFVHGKHPHELMVDRRQGPSHAGHADVPDDALRVGHGHYREQQREIRHELR